MAPKVLLIYPPVYDFAAFDLYNKPLGLLYIASFLRQAGCEPVLIDAMDRHHPEMVRRDMTQRQRPNGTGKYYSQRIEKPLALKHVPRYFYRFGMPRDLMAQLLSEHQSDPPAAVLVTSMMTYWYPGVADTIELVRELLPQVPVGLGGVYARLMPDHARKVCRPDRVFENPDPAETVKWIRSLTTDVQSCRANMPFHQWPPPAYDLYAHLPYLMIMTSLGCPYQCDYCSSRFLQPKLQVIDPETVAGQIDQMLTLLDPDPYYRIAFGDDALLLNADDHFNRILDLISQRNLPTRFYTPNGLHCRFISPAVADRMFKNGFEMIRLSYEASDEAARWQAASDHKVSDTHFHYALENLLSAGYHASQLEAYVLVGMPSQTLEEAAASVRAVHRAGLRARLCQFTPIPHTPLFQTACHEYGVNPDEPLLHNNSILATLDRRVTMDNFQNFKNFVNDLNSRLPHP